MAKRTCSVDGCGKPHSGRGFCAAHYQNWHRCGDPLGMRIERQKTCDFPGCGKPHESRGYCRSHAGQLRRLGEVRPLRSYGGGPCSVDGCDEPLTARGYCTKHWQRWRTHGDPLRVDQGREGSRRYTLNESFFDEITTEAQAYWLGFITADGGIIKSRKTFALRVDLSVRDEDHLTRMVQDLGSNRPVRRQRTFACVSFDSWRLVESLARLGVVSRKSATVEPWDGPSDLMRHYWRGMFDGDGSIGRVKRDGLWAMTLCGSRACVETFAGWAGDVCGSRASARHVKGGCWSWSVMGSRKPQHLARELYDGATVALERKRSMAAELVATDYVALRAESRARQSASLREAWATGRHPRARLRMT